MVEIVIPDYPRGLTFETVWAAIHANAEKSRRDYEELHKSFQEVRELQKETDRIVKETDRIVKETDRIMKENAERQKKTDRIVKKTSKQMGDLHNRFGELAEHMVAPGIAKRFNELGYHFDSILPGGRKILDSNGKVRAEIDLLLENEDSIIAVEVKTKPALKDVDHHVKRLEILREHRDKWHDGRKIYGAIAGAIFGSEEKGAVRDAGLYVVEQSGDTMKIDMLDGFVPQIW
jgi:hypothetical protein